MKRFPADPAIRQIWINNVRRADWNWNPPANFRNCRLCEVHFDEEQFEYKSPDGSYRRFKPGAIPTVFNVNSNHEGQSGIPSFGVYCSRRRKKIVGNYDPSLCASNLNQVNRFSSLHKSPSNAGETPHCSTTTPQERLESLLDQRNPKGNLPSGSLSVASYMTDHSDFAHASNQIQYNYHKRFDDNSPSISLAFHGREVDTVHLPNIPISTAERFNIFSSVAASRTSVTSDAELTGDNVQTMLEPGEIKLEYIADSPASDNEASSDKSISVKPSSLLTEKHEDNIQTTVLQEIPQTVIHEKFQNLPLSIQPLLSMTHRNEGSHGQSTSDLPQNVKIDYDFTMSASDSSLNIHYPESATNHLPSTSKVQVPTSTLSVAPLVSVPIKKDLTFLPNSSESSHEEEIQKLIPIEKRGMREKSQTPVIREDATSNKNSKYQSDIQISSGNQFSNSSNESHGFVMTKRNVLLKSICQQSECEHSTEEQSDIEVLDINPSSHSISCSVSSGRQLTRKNIKSPAEKKDRPVRGRNRFYSKHLLADHLQKKLNEEKRKSRKLRLENQKLRKQLGPLRSLNQWIAKFMGTDQIKQLENLGTRETTFETLQKALKMCSLVCGYLSTVVNFPFYSTQTRPV